MNSQPCMCGDIGCPSCGPAQGYPIGYLEEEHCYKCGRKLSDEDICTRTDCACDGCMCRECCEKAER